MSSFPRRVLIVCRSLPCHVPGGIEYHVVDLAAGLRRLGVDVGLLSTPVPPSYRAGLEQAGMVVHEVAGVAPGQYTRAYFRRVGGAIDRAVEERKYDVVHGQEFGPGLWKGGRAPLREVLTVHGTITSETALHPDVWSALSFRGRWSALRRYGRRYFFTPIWNRMLRRAERILVDSEFTRGELRRLHPELEGRVRVVPLGVDMGRYAEVDPSAARRELGWPAGGPVQLITVGRLEWQKGHDLAIDALARLREQAWTYWIVGEGSARSRIERRIRDQGLGERIRVTGRVDADAKSRMLAASDLFLWPERTHPAFGLVGLEALLMNTPVLGARRGAIPELIDGESGWTHAPESVEALAAALEPLLREPERLSAMARGLRERTLRRFEPDAMARGTLAVYRELSPG